MSELKIVLHAPTPGALTRARSNATNLRNAEPNAQIRIVANGEAINQAVAERDAGTDECLVLCNNSLKKKALEAPEGIEVTTAGILLLAQLQQEGWIYIRA